jgi:putative hydrolase of the HAD superfamily
MKKYKGILLDLDNTLYNYKLSHQAGLSQAYTFLNKHISISREDFLDCYNQSRTKVKDRTAHTAASHHRLLYFQDLLETLEIPAIPLSLKLYEMYWQHYFQAMKLYPGALTFLDSAKQNRKKIGIITNLTAEIQYRKLEHLRIAKYIDYLTTSEEIGIEKPDPKIFFYALKKMCMNPHEVCMIGDDIDADIYGASSYGIDTFLLQNVEDIITKKLDTQFPRTTLTVFKDFKTLQGLFHEQTQELR